jgi:hypothetical protein
MSDYDTDFDDEDYDTYSYDNDVNEQVNECTCNECNNWDDVSPTSMTCDGVSITNQNVINNNSVIACEACNRYFDEKLIDKSDNTFVKCLHCYFFFKYDEFKNDRVLDEEGEKLLKYFELCSGDNIKEGHNVEKCVKVNNGGCLLCEYIDGRVPKSVERILQKNIKKDSEIKLDSSDVTICGGVYTDKLELMDSINIKL